MENNGYPPVQSVETINAAMNQIGRQGERMKARASRNGSVLVEIARADGIDPEAVYKTIEGVFATIPSALVVTGLNRKLEEIGRRTADLARACAPITKPTIYKWMQGRKLGVTELGICILGLCRLSGESAPSCAGSVAALCDRETLEGGEDATRRALIERIMKFTEIRLKAADTPTLNAIAALVCTEQAERHWREVKIDY